MKLVRQAHVWCTGVENKMRDAGQPPIVHLEEMKLHLKRKYLPYNYRDELFDQLIALRQGSLTIMKYMNKFEELKIRCTANTHNLSQITQMIQHPIYNGCFFFG